MIRRAALVLLLLAAAVPALAQTSDRELLRRADFSSKQIIETPPAGANAAEKTLWGVRRQLTGTDRYEPANYMFFRPAVRELGLIPAFFATSDRILRDTRLGTVRALPDPSDGKIHEGPEAYAARSRELSVGGSGIGVGETDGMAAVSVSHQVFAPQTSIFAPETDGKAAVSVSRCGDDGGFRPVDADFVQYLIENDLKKDARELLFGSQFQPSDTLTFLRGWTLYQLKELEAANSYLAAVPQESPFYDKAFFYSNAVSAHMGDYDGATSRLQDYSGPYAELKGVQLAGLALLRDDPEAFKAAAGAFSYSDYALETAERDMDEIFHVRYETPKKSPWLAAGASALVPGLGKIYAGQLGEGISTFLVTGAMGAITAEHWIKDGPGDWKTIVPAVLTGILYIGNIYGAYMSVSIYNSQLYDAQETTLLYSVHIPLRTVFK